jgi:hypothetical protein
MARADIDKMLSVNIVVKQVCLTTLVGAMHTMPTLMKYFKGCI